ncbi:hypothetical protein VHEMI10295 [[Torrubiella] hemipterigena]|uniref:Uncharacterized protein n=1 Tax=[Torrubiella] hemipterigena TaxID=1531966 RepID=A0A0A1TRX9_9HYPO|nr:hypothetical protein VHEMI10295 [[Torrubiella] hemipterigena]
MPATVPVFLPLVTDKQANKHTNTASSPPSSFTNNTEDVSTSFTQNVVKTSSFIASPPCDDVAACTCITNDLTKIETTIRILDILESFGTHITKDPRLQGKWIGKPKFLHHVISRVRKEEPIQLTMPAFPCKSVRPLTTHQPHIAKAPLANPPLGQSRKQGPWPFARPW